MPESDELKIRSCGRRDLDAIEAMLAAEPEPDAAELHQIRRWYGIVKGLSFFPNPFQHLFSSYVAERGDRLCGMIQVSPFNKTHSTWRIDRLLLKGITGESGKITLPTDVGSQLIRHCLQHIWEARTWMMEVEVGDDMLLGLSRQNGFQPLANLTYWAIAPDSLEQLQEEATNLPPPHPVSNAHAGLLHQLDTFSMPPTVRQVFDRHVTDFRSNPVAQVGQGLKHWMDRTEVVQGYIFQPQRKAAIGYFKLNLCKDGSRPHAAELTVHPEYTLLYPEILSQMARAVQVYPSQMLCVTSADYQTEREEYLSKLGATPTERTILLSRSVWHKVRESRMESLQWQEMLQGLQPSQTPIPSRFSFDRWGRQFFYTQTSRSAIRRMPPQTRFRNNSLYYHRPHPPTDDSSHPSNA